MIIELKSVKEKWLPRNYWNGILILICLCTAIVWIIWKIALEKGLLDGYVKGYAELLDDKILKG